jgi:GTPase SAR1 family protein
MRYSAAHIILAGNTGVGKSGLAAVLGEWAGPFTATDSTHARAVRLLARQQTRCGQEAVLREAWLWDLAGQPIYRLVHQLYLGLVAVGVVVYDPTSPTDPLAGVHAWSQFLRAQAIQHPERPPIRTILVAARVDQPGRRIAEERVRAVVEAEGFDLHLETSAKEGWGIAELQAAILQAIRWEDLPAWEAPPHFPRMRELAPGQALIAERELAGVLAAAATTAEREQAARGLALLEQASLIRRLASASGDDQTLLLAPEYLDAYASGLVVAVRDDPDEKGRLPLGRVLEGRFALPGGVRLPERERAGEPSLLLTMTADLLQHEIALVQTGRDGAFLVFPSLGVRPLPAAFAEREASLVYGFEGPLHFVFATLAVRLARCGRFHLRGVWENAVTYADGARGTYCIRLRYRGEGRGELALFFGAKTAQEGRLAFERFLAVHLRERTLPECLARRRSITCPVCTAVISAEQVGAILARGRSEVRCPVCETVHPLAEELDPQTLDAALVADLEQAADDARALEVAQLMKLARSTDPGARQ